MSTSSPPDAAALELPRPDPAAATACARDLAAAATAAAQVAAGLDRLRAGPQPWRGVAHDLVDADQVDVQAELELLAGTLARAARVLTVWAQEAPGLVAAMAAARTEVEAARRARAVALATGDALWRPRLSDGPDHGLGPAWGRWERARDAYWRSARRATTELTDVLRALPDRRPTVGGNALDLGRGLWQFGVLDPVTDTWALSGAMFTAPDTFRAAWKAVPGNLWQTVRHPVRTAAQELDADAWRRGRYGEGLAAVLVAGDPRRVLALLRGRTPQPPAGGRP